jgi:hypothetical protein
VPARITIADEEITAVFWISWSEAPLGYRLRSRNQVPAYLALQEGAVLEEIDPDSLAFMFFELAVLEPEPEVLKIPVGADGVRWVPLQFRDQLGY